MVISCLQSLYTVSSEQISITVPMVKTEEDFKAVFIFSLELITLGSVSSPSDNRTEQGGTRVGGMEDVIRRVLIHDAEECLF